MTATYWDHVKSGALAAGDALKYQSVRQATREDAGRRVKESKDAAEPFVFGWLDVIAVVLVKWYGPQNAADVFRHYGDVCAGRADKVEGGS